MLNNCVCAADRNGGSLLRQTSCAHFVCAWVKKFRPERDAQLLSHVLIFLLPFFFNLLLEKLSFSLSKVSQKKRITHNICLFIYFLDISSWEIIKQSRISRCVCVHACKRDLLNLPKITIFGEINRLLSLSRRKEEEKNRTSPEPKLPLCDWEKRGSRNKRPKNLMAI